MKFVPLVVLACAFAVAGLRGQEAKSRATEHTLTALPNSLYFVVPPRQPPAKGKRGPLLVVLPGGTATRDFLPFVENGICGQAPDDCTGVLITAVKWQPEQSIIWPTGKNKVPGMQYTTDAYVRAVVAEVEKTHAIDPTQRVVLAWSSSGPAVYPLMVAKDSPFARSYIAMSIWPGRQLGDLAPVKGRRFFLDQSPEDETTKFSHVRDALPALVRAGAVVRLSTYTGGHGWNDAPLPRIHEGLRWLLSDEPAPKPEWPDEKKPPKKGKAGARDGSLIDNGDFEKGLDGWRELDNSGRLDVVLDEQKKHGGKQSLHLNKAGAMPLDLVMQEIDDLPASGKVTASVWLMSSGAKNAWVKVWLYGADDKPVHEDVNLVHVTVDGEWREYTKTWEVAGAKRAVVQIVMVLGGELWVDDVSLVPGK